MASIIEHTAPRLKRLLRQAATPAASDSAQRFFKQPVRALGVRTPQLRRLTTQAAREYRRARLGFDDVLPIADRLWTQGALEERILAVLLLGKFRRQLERRHWRQLDRWVRSLSNWAETDALCVELLAPLLQAAPELIDRLIPWTRSRQRWRRRAAAVALVPAARRGEHHAVAFDIVDRMAGDRDDMVEKATGWLLKEISRTQPRAVADFLLADIDRFSRTTVRYGCEKLPTRLRAKVMSA